MSENDEKGQQTQAVSAPVSMEMLKYKEELASKMGLPSPYGMQLMKEAAADMVASGMVPKCFANNPMAVYLAAMRGREMGLSPMESVLETFFPAPGGNLGMYAKKMLQIMHSRGVVSKFLTETDMECAILFIPPLPHEPYTARFTIEEAQKAGIIKPDGNWMKWRTDMNRARAISRGWRALAGTFEGGCAMYSKEELSDVVSPESTMDEPNEADRQRTAQLASPMGDYKVALKPDSKVVDLKPEPEPAEDTPAPAKAEPPAASQTPAPTAEPPVEAAASQASPATGFSIKMAMDTGSGGKKFIPVNGEGSQSTLASAHLRAQALANETGVEHCVYQNSNDALMASCKPPTKMPPPVKDPPTQESGNKAIAKARMEALCAKLPDIAPKTATARFSAFISGYLGMPLKQLSTASAEQVTDSLDALEVILDRDVDEFRSGPEEAGKRMKERRDGIVEYTTKLWPKNPEACRLALLFGLKSGHSLEAFKQWFEYVGLDFMPEPDAHALLRVFNRTRVASEFVKLRKQFPALSVAKAVEQIEARALPGTSIEAAPVKDLEASVMEFCRKAREAAAEPKEEKQAEPPAPEKAPAPGVPAELPVEDEPDGGLFGGGGW